MQIDYFLGRQRWKNAAHHSYSKEEGLDSDHIPVISKLRMKFRKHKPTERPNTPDWARATPEQLTQHANAVEAQAPQPNLLDETNANEFNDNGPIPSKQR